MRDRMSEIFWHPVTAASRAPRFPTTWPRNDGLWGRECTVEFKPRSSVLKLVMCSERQWKSTWNYWNQGKVESELNRCLLHLFQSFICDSFWPEKRQNSWSVGGRKSDSIIKYSSGRNRRILCFHIVRDNEEGIIIVGQNLIQEVL